MLLPATSMQLFWSYFTIENMSVNRRKRGYDGSLSPIQPQTFVYSIPNKGLKRLKKVFFLWKRRVFFFFIEKKEASFVEGLDVPFWYYLIVVQDEGGVH